MVENATGLVLRTRPLTETSLIVQWLTPDVGRLATVAKGARRPKSPFRGKLDLFYVADFSFARNRRSELHTLREVSLRETHSRLRQELGYVQQASYGAGLIEQATETETPLPGIFELMSGLLGHLPSQAPQPQTIFAFELKLLTNLGLQPDPARIQVTAGTRALVRMLVEADWPAIARVRLSEAQIGELGAFLHRFLAENLGKIHKSRAGALG